MFSLDNRNEPNHFERIKEKMIRELCRVYKPEPKLKDPTNCLEVIKYKVLHERHIADERKFETDWLELYSVIWEKFCGNDLRIILKDSPDFESKIRN